MPNDRIGLRLEPDQHTVFAFTVDDEVGGTDGAGWEVGIMLFSPPFFSPGGANDPADPAAGAAGSRSNAHGYHGLRSSSRRLKNRKNVGFWHVHLPEGLCAGFALSPSLC
jgi:hypothetical protein